MANLTEILMILLVGSSYVLSDRTLVKILSLKWLKLYRVGR